MTLQALGDVEFVVVRLQGDRLSPHLLEALLTQVESGSIRLLDFLIVQRLDGADCRMIEIDRDEFTLAGLALDTPGLICEDDARHFAARLPISSLAAVILVEPTWGERFSRDLDHRYDHILATQPIPASVANEVLSSALEPR